MRRATPITPQLTAWFAFLLSCACLPQAHAQLTTSNVASDALQRALRPQKLALVIGINRSLRTTYWPTLRYAHRDAARMAKALRRWAQFDRIVQLNTAPTTTRSAIIRALKRFNKLAKSPSDTVLVYISAHGTVSQGRTRYIVASDTTQRISQTGISVPSIRAMLRKSRSQQVGLILATCYTGIASAKTVRAPGIKGRVKPKPMTPGRAIQILSAAGYAQPAFESNALQADVYTHFFLDCLTRLARKSIINLHVCAAAKTTPYVKTLNGEVQVPKAYSIQGANRDFVLASASKKRKKGYFRASWRRGKRWVYRIVRINQKSGPAAQITTAQDETTALPPGRYRIEVTTPEGQLQHTEIVNVRPDQVAFTASDWALGWQGAATISEKLATGWLAGGWLTLHHRYFGLAIGLSGTAQRYRWSPTGHHLLSELRAETGMRFEWHKIDLFIGGYASFGVVWGHVLHPTEEMQTALHIGLGAQSTLRVWLTGRWGISLQIGGGLSIFSRASLSIAPELSFQLGPTVRL